MHHGLKLRFKRLHLFSKEIFESEEVFLKASVKRGAHALRWVEPPVGASAGSRFPPDF